MTITPEEMREKLVEAIARAIRVSQAHINDMHGTAAAVLAAIEAQGLAIVPVAPNEAVERAHEWCGDDPNPSTRPKPILEQMADYDEDNWFSE